MEFTPSRVTLQDNQTDSGMVLASEELKRIEHQQRDAASKRLVLEKKGVDL